MNKTDSRIPVVVLSGFLGSGKTTLLNAILRQTDSARTAVIINEFGEISIDHLLVKNVTGNTIVLKNGCICCVIQSDLQSALRDLLHSISEATLPIDRIIIETTGLADPGPIARTIGSDMMLQRQIRLAGIISTVDAVHGLHQSETHEESVQQICVSDVLIVTKTDIADPDALDPLLSRLKALNPSAQRMTGNDVIEHFQSNIDLLTSGSKNSVTAWSQSVLKHKTGIASTLHGDIETVSIESDSPIDWAAFSVWLSAFIHHHGDRVLRIKAILATEGDMGPIALHVVRSYIHPPSHLDPDSSDNNRSTIVFIVKGMDVKALRSSLRTFVGLG